MLPQPPEVRAIVVGLERFPGLGAPFDLPGAAAAAISFAAYLTGLGVDPAHIDVWLTTRDGTDIAQACADAGLASERVHAFDWEAFRVAMSDPLEPFDSGSFLIVYFAGHGAVNGHLSEQYLILPTATERQFRCIQLENWRQLFRCFGWQRFERQLWVVDACRTDWGQSITPNVDHWHVEGVAAVRQCMMLSCAVGETAGMMDMPVFTRALLDALRRDGGRSWPDFEQVFASVTAGLVGDPLAPQLPVMRIERWDGSQVEGPALVGPSIKDLLSEIGWIYKQFVPYVRGALAVIPQPVMLPDSLPDSLPEAIARLNELPAVGGIPPLLDFVERVARAAHSEKLQRWVAQRLTPHLRAELADRLRGGTVRVRLSLWYREDDVQGPFIEGDLDIVVDAGGIRPWPRLPAKPVPVGRDLEVLAEWVSTAFDHVSGMNRTVDLEVELFLPMSLLGTAEYDIAAVELDDDELRLGEDYPVVLRCTDRSKGKFKYARFREQARKVLARLERRADGQLRWVHPHENVEAWTEEFFAEGAEAVWLGFDAASSSPAPLSAALKYCLPAAVWCRSAPRHGESDELRASLRELLKSSLDALPAALKKWRTSDPRRARSKAALLLDDPDRLPAIWSPMAQPGE